MPGEPKTWRHNNAQPSRQPGRRCCEQKFPFKSLRASWLRSFANLKPHCLAHQVANHYILPDGRSARIFILFHTSITFVMSQGRTALRSTMLGQVVAPRRHFGTEGRSAQTSWAHAAAHQRRGVLSRSSEIFTLPSIKILQLLTRA
jgi:hypothetical protein